MILVRVAALAPVLALFFSLGPSAAAAQAGGQAATSAAQAPTAADQPPAGLSGDEEARMRFELGRRYYDTGRFEEAAREFAEAHRLSGRTELLYNLFLAYRDSGDDQHAAETLRTYIPTLEVGERRTQLEARLRVLEQRLAGGGGSATGGGATTGGGASETSGSTGSGTSGSGTSGSGTSGSGTSGSGTSGSGTSGSGTSGSGTSGSGTSGSGTSGSGGGLGAVPWVIVGVGGALVLGSVITGVLALDARSSLDRMCAGDGSCPPGYEGTQSSGQALAITTDVLWVTGAVALGTGVVLAIVDMSSGSSSNDASAAGACTGDGCFFSVSGRF